MSSPALYTAKDIERYHRGEMTGAERHALEKAALEDPMLADALEGYTLTNTATTDLQQLQNRLQNRIDKEKKGSVLFLRNGWMKIAAVFFFVTASGWLVFQNLATRKDSLAAMSQESKTAESSTDAASDSITTSRQDSPYTLYKDSSSASETKEENAGGRQELTAATALQTTPNKPAKTIKADKEFRQTPVLDKKKELPAARENPADNLARKGKSASPIDHLANDTTYGITSEPSPASQEEVSANRRLVQPAAKMRLARTAEPANGWPAFEKYVAENKKSLKEAAGGSLAYAAVELLFDLDGSGKPINITVARSACRSCDAEAIRLLKEGPAWKGTNGRVIIRFPN
jgi:hypothetical protein